MRCTDVSGQPGNRSAMVARVRRPEYGWRWPGRSMIVTPVPTGPFSLSFFLFWKWKFSFKRNYVFGRWTERSDWTRRSSGKIDRRSWWKGELFEKILELWVFLFYRHTLTPLSIAKTINENSPSLIFNQWLYTPFTAYSPVTNEERKLLDDECSISFNIIKMIDL